MGTRRGAAALMLAMAGIGCAGSLVAPARTDDPGIERLVGLRLSSDPKLCPFAITVAVHDRNRASRARSRATPNAAAPSRSRAMRAPSRWKTS
jgi:hypothetical protein